MFVEGKMENLWLTFYKKKKIIHWKWNGGLKMRLFINSSRNIYIYMHSYIYFAWLPPRTTVWEHFSLSGWICCQCAVCLADISMQVKCKMWLFTFLKGKNFCKKVEKKMGEVQSQAARKWAPRICTQPRQNLIFSSFTTNILFNFCTHLGVFISREYSYCFPLFLSLSLVSDHDSFHYRSFHFAIFLLSPPIVFSLLTSISRTCRRHVHFGGLWKFD